MNQPFFYGHHSECLVENRVKGKGIWGRGPSRETQEEAGENQGVLDPGGSHEGGEKWSGWGGILQLQWTGFPDGRNMGCKRVGIVENNSNVFNLSNCKKEGAIGQDRKDGGRQSGNQAGREPAGAGE